MYKIQFIKAENLESIGNTYAPVVPRIGEFMFFDFDGNNNASFRVVDIEHLYCPSRESDGTLEYSEKTLIWQFIAVSVFLERYEFP